MRASGLPVALLLAALALAPAAQAWSAAWSQPVDHGLSVRTSLLVAGDLSATGRGLFALPEVRELSWGPSASVRVCPDRAGEPDPDCVPSPATAFTSATLRVITGGLVLQPLGPARVQASLPAGAALLGGADLALNALPTGPALFAAGAARVEAEAGEIVLRPLGSGTRLVLEGREGARTLDGVAYTLRVAGPGRVLLEGSGAMVSLRPGDGVSVSRGGLARAEDGLRVEGLLQLQRDALPPESPPRRAHLADAFGPFQLVPVLLDGVVAAHANATLDGEPQEGFTLVRVDAAAVRLEGDRWLVSGDASYLVQGDVVAAAPGARVDPPILAPLVLAGLALCARALTPRETPKASRRRWALVLRLAGFPLLVLLADLFAAPLLGVHPLLDGGSLSPRSRVQLALLALGMGLVAWALVGLAVESLARSAFALRGRPAALAVPVLLGLAAAGVLLFLGHAPLLSLVARLVRL